MKLWQKGESIDQLFERFTIGNDPVLDLEFAYYDIVGTIAHVKMLGAVNLIPSNEVDQLVQALEDQLKIAEEGQFEIEEGIEDCHSQIELNLTRSLGDIGKKVHAGRSRNDQVITALKLYTKNRIEEIALGVKVLFDLFLEKSGKYEKILMPGYTHLQVAMPSSFGLWFGAYAESLTDDLILLKAAHEVVDKNPLGSAAGYGNSFPLNRDMTTTDLKFKALNVNSIYAQMTRGKMEKTTAFALSSLAGTLAKFSEDVCLYNGQNFNFFKLDKKYTTGSSIMPHKHNPDGFELARGRCNQIMALPNELTILTANLPSGYHRDLQLLKDHFLPAVASMMDSLTMVTVMTEHLEVNEDLIDESRYDLLFTVEEVNRMVLEGIPFRDAYQKVGKMVNEGSYIPDRKVKHTHIGSVGNLANDRIRESFEEVFSFFT